MAKSKAAVKKELPSLFCVDCREWVDSQEKTSMFAEVDGVKKVVTIWRCPKHRKERHEASNPRQEVGRICEGDQRSIG
jgi:hypothetical protein